MIDILKKILWKVEGMDYNDNPSGSKGSFGLYYGKLLIGILSYENGQWTFKYSDEFRNSSILMPIIDFPDKNKVYVNANLWPFFAARIPTLNQPFQKRKMEKANVRQDDAVGLLRLFGSETITNPYRLSAV